MHSYIGVSKLSCRGCRVFIWAMSAIYGTNFCTRGLVRSDELTEQVYRLLAGYWITTYHGYRPRRVPPRPNSTAPSVKSPVNFGAPFPDDNPLRPYILLRQTTIGNTASMVVELPRLKSLIFM